MSEQRFVKVRASASEFLAVPLSPNGKLSLNMLKIGFPRAYGLTYTNQIVHSDANTKYLVYFDGKEFFSDPIAEWNGIFDVICTPPPPPLTIKEGCIFGEE
uniref:TAR DNA-binding protein 43 N-terminal domain-containing protein n=2 Tax=Meloidogyne TaxID=189290 RepID=A0A914LH72_MELIC